MSKKDFDDFLSKKEKEQKDIPKVNWEIEKKEWLSYLEALYKLFEESLKDYIKQSKIKIKYDDIEITEESIGNYKAKRMIIEFANEKIILKPIGTNLIGAKGRVDMVGKVGSVQLVLVDSRMKSIRDHIKVSIHVGIEIPKENIQDREEAIIWEWKFITAPPTKIYQPVNEDTIYSAMMELSNA